MTNGDSSRRRVPDWLAADTRDWVQEHGAVLDRIYAAFHGSGNWPDPVQLDRELRAGGLRLGIVGAVETMPRELGWREWSPSCARLSLFGLGCVPAARGLLSRYVQVLYLALERYDEADQENRLTRHEVVERLAIGDAEADRLSQVLVDDCPFLGSGMANVGGWNLEVDPRATAFEGVEDADSFLRVLAEQRQISSRSGAGTSVSVEEVPVEDVPVPASSGSAEKPGGGSPDETPRHSLIDPTRHSEPRRWANGVVGAGLALLAVLAIGANAAGVLSAPLPLLAAVGTSALCAAVLHRSLRRPQPSLRSVGAVLVAGAVAAVIAYLVDASTDSSDAPTRYFVHPTKGPLLRRSERPSRTAHQLVSEPLGDQDQVVVVCVTPSEDNSGRWARLEDGTFVPLDQLVATSGGGSPNDC